MCVSLMNGIGIFCIYLILLRRVIKIMTDNNKKELLVALLKIRNRVSSGSYEMGEIDHIFKREGYMSWKAPHGTERLEDVPRIYS